MTEWFSIIKSLNKVKWDSLEDFVSNLFSLAMSFSVVIVVIAVIIAGYKYMFSKGDDEKVKEATRSLLFALIGLVIVFLAPTIVRFVLDKLL